MDGNIALKKKKKTKKKCNSLAIIYFNGNIT